MRRLQPVQNASLETFNASAGGISIISDSLIRVRKYTLALLWVDFKDYDTGMIQLERVRS
jgi:hypothetical protein